MPMRSGKSNIADLEVVRQQAEVIQKLILAVQVRDERIQALEGRLSEARRDAQDAQGRAAQQEARAKAAKASVKTQEPPFQPGFAPIQNLAAWRSSQLGDSR